MKSSTIKSLDISLEASKGSRDTVHSLRSKRCTSHKTAHLKPAPLCSEDRNHRQPTCTPAPVLSLLRQAYGNAQVGALDDRLKGFKLTTEDTKIEDAEEAPFDFTYGEMLPRGVTKVLGTERILPSAQARTLLDLGMGTGKFAMQAFLEVPWLEKVVGVELTHARFDIAAKALKKLAARNPGRFGCQVDKNASTGQVQALRLVERSRSLEFRLGDIFQTETELISKADAIIMAVAFPTDIFGNVQQLLKHAKQGCRLLTYEDFELEASDAWDPPAPRAFRRLECNRVDDYYPVSWVPKPGHLFFLHEVGAFHSRAAKSTAPLRSERQLSR